AYSLLSRRLLLASVVQGTAIVLSPLLEGYSSTALEASARLGFRGIVAKRAGSAYRSTSLTAEWAKMTFPVTTTGCTIPKPPRVCGAGAPRPMRPPVSGAGFRRGRAGDESDEALLMRRRFDAAPE